MIELLLAGDRLLEAGDLDRAERIYQQVVEADPRNAIAVVGLARVAHARGSQDEAVALAARAVGIDPEDQAAQRLEVELARAAPPAPEATPAPSADTEGRRSILDRLKSFLRRAGG